MATVKRPAPKPAAAAKKTAVKPASPQKKKMESETGIKYEDKSPGQPQLVPIFDEIKKLLLPYGKGVVKVRGGSGGQIILASEKPVVIDGKERKEFWCAAALIQRGYVGFYFMPVNTPAAMKEIFEPALLKCLKGKSCFYIKKYDPELFKQIKAALAKGFQEYKKRGLL